MAIPEQLTLGELVDVRQRLRAVIAPDHVAPESCHSPGVRLWPGNVGGQPRQITRLTGADRLQLGPRGGQELALGPGRQHSGRISQQADASGTHRIHDLFAAGQTLARFLLAPFAERGGVIHHSLKLGMHVGIMICGPASHTGLR
jgi:hypothetical protein